MATTSQPQLEYTTIAVVEDDESCGRLLKHLLNRDGYQVVCFDNAGMALDGLARLDPDLALIDLMMPDMTGLELTRKIRERHQHERMPIILLSARDERADRYDAFAFGADDFITKPYDSVELLYRVAACLRLAKRHASVLVVPIEQLEVGGIRLDPDKYLVTLRGEQLALTVLETVMLHFLMSHPGKVFSADRLSVETLGKGKNSVDSAHAHIRHLRLKLEIDPKSPQIIVTMGRKGYYFNA